MRAGACCYVGVRRYLMLILFRFYDVRLMLFLEGLNV